MACPLCPWPSDALCCSRSTSATPTSCSASSTAPTLVQSWRLQTLRERTSDELGLLVDGLFAHSRIERVQIRGVILGSVVPPLTGTIRAMVQRYFGVTALVVEPGVNTSMPILYEQPVRGRRRSHRQRRRGLREVRQGPRQAADRRRLRHGDDARCDHREGRISRRRDLSRRARFPPTRCFSARRACRASTSASRRASSAGRRSARWSRGCSGDTWGWSRGWCGA